MKYTIYIVFHTVWFLYAYTQIYDPDFLCSILSLTVLYNNNNSNLEENCQHHFLISLSGSFNDCLLSCLFNALHCTVRITCIARLHAA